MVDEEVTYTEGTTERDGYTYEKVYSDINYKTGSLNKREHLF